MGAPRVVAKGLICWLPHSRYRHRNRVPVLEAPPLARALYANTEVDAEVPMARTAPWRRCWPMYQLKAV